MTREKIKQLSEIPDPELIEKGRKLVFYLQSFDGLPTDLETHLIFSEIIRRFEYVTTVTWCHNSTEIV